MLFCLKSLRDGECFCSRYDENRQTMFYCGFFTTIAGFIWFIIGFTIRCAFFAEAFGPSVDAVACGIMVVGLMILVIGLFSTISIVCTSKPNNKTRCVSTTTNPSTATSSIYSDDSGRRLRRNGDKQRMDKMFNVFDIPTTFKQHQHLDDGGHYPPTSSFGSSELNSSFLTRTSSSAMSASSSSRPSTCSQNSQHCNRSDIVMIA